MLMELQQGDKFQFYESGDRLYITVNDGPSWRASPRGCEIVLNKDKDGKYTIAAIIKEEGPAVAISALRAITNQTTYRTLCGWPDRQGQVYVDKTCLTLQTAIDRIQWLTDCEKQYALLEERPVRWEYWYEREEVPCLSSKESPGGSGW
jgi:hypothetical protein